MNIKLNDGEYKTHLNSTEQTFCENITDVWGKKNHDFQTKN